MCRTGKVHTLELVQKNRFRLFKFNFGNQLKRDDALGETARQALIAGLSYIIRYCISIASCHVSSFGTSDKEKVDDCAIERGTGHWLIRADELVKELKDCIQ